MLMRLGGMTNNVDGTNTLDEIVRLSVHDHLNCDVCDRQFPSVRKNWPYYEVLHKTAPIAHAANITYSLKNIGYFENLTSTGY